MYYPYTGTGTTRFGPAAALHARPFDPLREMWKQSQGNAAGHPARLERRATDTEGLLAILQGRPKTKPSKHFADVTFVAPKTFAKPQPRPDLSHILNWQDRTGRCSPQRNTRSPHKGITENILLATGSHRSGDRKSNAAPAWPPAPGLITNPSNRGPKASAQPAAIPSLGLNIGLPLASTVSTGHFIGRDGTEWPLPPSECMPKPRPSQSPIAQALPPASHPLTLDSDRWTAPMVALGDACPENDDAPFVTYGDEVYGKQGTLSCSPVATALPRTPGDDDVLLPVRRASCKATQAVKPYCGVIGEGRPKPQPVCPPTPFLGPSLRLPSPPFVGSQAAYSESSSESEGGYWSSSASEYSDFDSDESGAWSVESAFDSDSDKEGDSGSEPDFFLASPL